MDTNLQAVFFRKELLLIFFLLCCRFLPAQVVDTVHVARNPDTTVYGVPNPMLMYARIPQFPDSMPQFGNGMEDQMIYINQHARYPEAEKRSGISGQVRVAFVVEEDGSLSGVHAILEVPNGPGLTAEAIRVVKSMPKWKPAVKDGRAVRCWSFVAVDFKLG